MPAQAGIISGYVVLELWRRGKGMMDECSNTPERDKCRREPAWGPKRVQCDVCNGRGWHPAYPDALDAWARHCTLCNGKGDLSLHTVAKLIGEDPGVIYRLHEQRIRARTARRILPKLTALCALEGLAFPVDSGACPAGGGNAAG